MEKVSFAARLSQWLALHSQGRKPRSVAFNQEIVRIIEREWPGYLNADSSAVTTAQVVEFGSRVSRYCPSRWNAMVSVLYHISPAGRVLRRRPLHSKERHMISQGEFSRLVEELRRRPRSHAGLVVMLLATTGMRISEARQLKWSHIEGNSFRLPGSITKNGKPRTIPFIPGVESVLEELRGAGEGERVLPQSECKRSLKTACLEAGVPPLSHHDFRHLFATRCIQSGVDLPTVARWLGHRDGGALLAKTYFHLVDDHSRAMAARVVV